MQVQARTTWRASPPAAAREDCTLCQGTGWLLASASGFSQARRCSCSVLSRTLRLKDQIRIPRRYERCTLDQYQPSTFSQARALAEARRFARRFPRVDRGLLFVGNPGTGKTHLAVGILLELLQRFHEDVLFFDFQSLLGPGRPISRQIQGQGPDFCRLKTASLLVLDDLDLVRASGETLPLIEDILSTRLRTGKVTVFTADKLEQKRSSRGIFPFGEFPAQPGLSPIHPRVVMLLINSVKVLPVAGEDYRQRQAAAAPLF